LSTKRFRIDAATICPALNAGRATCRALPLSCRDSTLERNAARGIFQSFRPQNSNIGPFRSHFLGIWTRKCTDVAICPFENAFFPFPRS